MPITPAKGFRDSAGALHATIEEAQRAEITLLFTCEVSTDGWTTEEIANGIIGNRDALLAILTTGPRTRPKARKTPGTSNPKRAIKRVSNEAAKEAFATMRAAAAANAVPNEVEVEAAGEAQ